MRFGTVLAAAAVTALADARVTSKWGAQRVREKRNHMERIYGPNLIGLHHPYTGKVDHKRFAQARTIPKQSYMNVDGVVFDADAWTAALYGLTAGFQYTEVTKVGQPMSNCFFAASNIIDDFE